MAALAMQRAVEQDPAEPLWLEHRDRLILRIADRPATILQVRMAAAQNNNSSYLDCSVNSSKHMYEGYRCTKCTAGAVATVLREIASSSARREHDFKELLDMFAGGGFRGPGVLAGSGEGARAARVQAEAAQVLLLL